MAVYLRSYGETEFDRREILRYAGAKGSTPELDELISLCIDEIRARLTYNVCFTELDVSFGTDTVRIGSIESKSRLLQKRLNGCKSAVVFAATVGIGIDRIIAKYGALSPSKALIFQAIGAERIESLCDTLQRDIASEKEKEGKSVTARVSPGYADVPLEMQKDIFALLDCPRRLGLTLNESLIMSPSKSVSAIFGIGI